MVATKAHERPTSRIADIVDLYGYQLQIQILWIKTDQFAYKRASNRL